MTEQDLHYFSRRMEEERSAAANATDERAAVVHRELAQRYREMMGSHQPEPSDQAPL